MTPSDRRLMLALVTVALAVRLLAAWSGGCISDEAFTYYVSSDGPVAALQAARGDLSPPGYYLCLWPLASLTHQPFWLRLPSVIFGSLVPALLLLIGERLHSREAGIGGALLYATAYPVWLADAQIRMYGLVAFLSMALVWLWLQALDSGRPRGGWITMGAVAVLLALTNFAGLAVVVGLLCVSLATPRLRRPTAGVLALGFVAGGLWLAYSLTGPSEDLTRTGLASTPVTGILASAAALTGLPALAPGRFWWLVGLVLWGLALWGMIVVIRRGRRLEVACAAAAFLFPAIGAVAANLRGAQAFQTRYLTPIAGLLFLALAVALSGRRLRWIVVAVVAANAWLVLRYPVDPWLWNQDWGAVARFVREYRRPGDALVIHQAYAMLGFDYAYAPATAHLESPGGGILRMQFSSGYPGPTQIPVTVPMLGPRLQRRLSRHPRVLLVLSQERGPRVRRWFARRYLVERQLKVSSLQSWGNIEVFLLVPAKHPA